MNVFKKLNEKIKEWKWNEKLEEFAKASSYAIHR